MTLSIEQSVSLKEAVEMVEMRRNTDISL